MKRIALSVAALVLTLAGAEMFSRIFFDPEPVIRFEQDKEVLSQIRLEQLTSLLKGDPELFWRFKPNQTLAAQQWPFFGVISNGRGVREDHEIPLEKPGDEIRILFLGDSCTFGYGVSQRQTFSEQLERSLEHHEGIGRVECINAGVPGYSLFQGLRYYATEGKGYGAKLVVASFGWNDGAVWDSISDLEHYDLIRQAQPPRFLRGSRLAEMEFHALHRNDARHLARRGPRPRLAPEEYWAVLNDLHREVAAQGARLLLLVWPMRGNIEPGNEHARTPRQAVMYQYAAANGVMLVDLVPLFIRAAAGQPAAAEDLFIDEGHVTARGHALISSALEEYLQSWVKEQEQGLPPKDRP